MDLIGPILMSILGPILLMVGLGALLRRKFEIDITTLGKLNIYLFVPAFVFDKVSTSKLSWSDISGVVGVSVIQVILLGVSVFAIGKALRTSRKTLYAIAMAVMFYNSGNFGLPLAELAYPAGAGLKDGAAVQSFVLLVQNVLTFTLGTIIAGLAGASDKWEALIKVFRLPVLYTMIAALAARAWVGADPVTNQIPILIAKPAEYLAHGLVPVALITLGAQLASKPRWPRWKPLSLVLVLRLLLGPVMMAGLLFVFHLSGWAPANLWPWPAELLILTAATPTAVNTLLLTLELEGDADLAADCVFWTTVFSVVTITGWLVVLRLCFGG